MDELTTFAKRLKEARERRNIKQNALALKIGVTAQTISAYEKAEANGKGKNPTLENAVAIANELEVSLDWLCGIEKREQKNDTLGEYARMISEIIEWDTVVFSSDTVEEDVWVGDPYNGGGYETCEKTYIHIKLCPGELQKFTSDLIAMHKLLIKGTITNDLYARWLNDRLKALDEIPAYTQLLPFLY